MFNPNMRGIQNLLVIASALRYEIRNKFQAQMVINWAT